MRRALILLSTCVTVIALSGTVAAGAPPSSVPNSGASNNCIALTSGVLFFRQHGVHLGAVVGPFAASAPGAQGDFTQAELARNGVGC